MSLDSSFSLKGSILPSRLKARVMLKRLLRKVQYGIFLLRIGGPKVFLPELKRQVYSRTTYFGMELDLDKDIAEVPSRMKLSVQPASEEDLKEALQKVKSESNEAAYQLVQRIWFYESGFHNCYVARTVDTSELCRIAFWLVFPTDSQGRRESYRKRLPWLREGDAVPEYGYTFEKYRGNRILPSMRFATHQMARRKGFKRLVAYVKNDNMAMLKFCEMDGYSKFEEMQILTLFFLTIRKHIKNQTCSEPVA